MGRISARLSPVRGTGRSFSRKAPLTSGTARRLVLVHLKKPRSRPLTRSLPFQCRRPAAPDGAAGIETACGRSGSTSAAGDTAQVSCFRSWGSDRLVPMPPRPPRAPRSPGRGCRRDSRRRRPFRSDSLCLSAQRRPCTADHSTGGHARTRGIGLNRCRFVTSATKSGRGSGRRCATLGRGHRRRARTHVDARRASGPRLRRRLRRARRRATYTVDGDTAELMTIDALTPGAGVGGRLLDAVATAARAAGAVRLRVMTTNGNLPALRLYQRTGFRLVELRPGAVDQARSRKLPSRRRATRAYRSATSSTSCSTSATARLLSAGHRSAAQKRLVVLDADVRARPLLVCVLDGTFRLRVISELLPSTLLAAGNRFDSQDAAAGRSFPATRWRAR